MKMRRKTMLVVMTLLLAYGLQVVYVKSLPSEQITILGILSRIRIKKRILKEICG